jgi:tRNA A37 threonylcarbamoyladenosine synthetase subunit TsaC/SUA5/YrdC
MRLDEQVLRAKITKLQEYRRLGLRTAGDIETYQNDLTKRVRSVILHFWRGYITMVIRAKPSSSIRAIRQSTVAHRAGRLDPLARQMLRALAAVGSPRGNSVVHQLAFPCGKDVSHLSIRLEINA